MYLLFAVALLCSTALAGPKFEGAVSRHISLPNQPAKVERALPQATRPIELHSGKNLKSGRFEAMCETTAAARRAKATTYGAYYSFGDGTLKSSLVWNGGFYGYPYAVAHAFPYSAVFNAELGNAWTMVTSSETLDMSEYVDSDGNLHMDDMGIGNYHMPTINARNASYTWSTRDTKGQILNCALIEDSWGMGVFDAFECNGFYIGYVDGYAYGSVTPYGPSNLTLVDIGKVGGPLVVDDVCVWLTTDTQLFATEDDYILVTIYDIQENDTLFYNAYIRPENIETATNGATCGVGKFVEIDEDGFETEVSPVLTGEVEVRITATEGCDYGIIMCYSDMEDEDDECYKYYNSRTYWWSDGSAAGIQEGFQRWLISDAAVILDARFNALTTYGTPERSTTGYVPDDATYNTLEDGTSYTWAVSSEGEGQTYNDFLVETTFGIDAFNFYYDEDIVLDIDYDDTYYADNNVIAFFVAVKALPEGMTGRECDVVLRSNDEVDYTIHIVQGVLSENNLILKDATAKQGTQTDVAVWMQNESKITDFQFDLVLPEGFSLAMNNNGSYLCELSSRATNSHSLACAKQEDGSYRFFCYSSSNSLFSGNDGELLSFSVIVPDNASVGEHVLQLKNGKMSEKDGTKHISADSYSVLNVLKNQIPITEISLSQKTVTLLEGESMALIAVIAPADATNKTLNWSSSNKSVATVSEDGIISAKSEGTATITVKTTDGSNLSASCRITVMSPGYTDINQLNNVLYSTETSAYPGKQVDVQINMKNTNAITSWQADLILPEGFSIAQDSYGDPAIWISGARTKSSKHSISSSLLDDGSIRLLCTSNTNKTFSGTDGEVATMTLNVADNVAPQDYPIIFSNISLVETTSESHWISRITSKLNVDSYTLGDVNNDGDINSIDLVGIVTFILETPIEGNIREAADLNHDNLINNVDYVSEVNVILGITTLNQLLTAAMPTEFARLVVDPFSIIQGKTMTINVQLDASDLYCSAQFDMVLPSGLRIVDCGSLAVTHSLSYNLLEDGSYRFLITSNRNDFLPAEVGILKITIEADKDLSLGVHQIVLEDIYLVKANTNYVNPDAENIYISVENTNCIDAVNDEKTIEKIYNIFGQKAEIESNSITKKGSQMINGELIIVK